jgi:hypothetical protein
MAKSAIFRREDLCGIAGKGRIFMTPWIILALLLLGTVAREISIRKSLNEAERYKQLLEKLLGQGQNEGTYQVLAKRSRPLTMLFRRQNYLLRDGDALPLDRFELAKLIDILKFEFWTRHEILKSLGQPVMKSIGDYEGPGLYE